MAAALTMVPLAGLAEPKAGNDLALFRQEIRPVLTGKCLNCHGSERSKGGLDLSRRAAALSGGDSGAALVPGKARASLLIERLVAGEMPPANPLSARQIEAFKKWVDAGAPFEGEPLTAARKRAGADWWSLQPIRRPALPRSRFDHLLKSPIDAFIFAELDKNGLEPSPPADRLALLRRVTFDLTGLPPTPQEIDAFLKDDSAKAYEKVVDRLLAAPAYGERWGRHWLDVVRYGESHGYEQNHLRDNAWPYRDYVIRSFNQDKPFDRFIVEQLAGDVVGKGDPHIEAATGFLVAGVHDTVGNQTEEGRRQQRANDLDDMVSTIGAAFLGLTLNCARCHDHKFDPISQKDYYRMTAVVAGVRHGERPLGVSRTGKQEQQAAAELRDLSAQLRDLQSEARAAVLRRQGVEPVPRPAVNVQRNVDNFPPVRARFVRFTVLATQGGDEPCLDELEIYSPGSPDNVALSSRGARATASSLLPGHRIHQVRHLNDGKHGNDWSWISNERGQGWAQIELPAPTVINRVVWSRDSAGDRPRFRDRLASRYRIEVSDDGKSWQTVATHAERATASEAIPVEKLVEALPPAQRARHARLTAELAKLRAFQQTRTQTAYIGQFTAPDPIYLLERGDVMKRGELVTPGGLSQLPRMTAELTVDPVGGEAGRRLALARWIVDPRNPLTARVIVNRVWQHHFGQGIVGTPSDFGASGQKPSHPELLDWLASTLRDGGWSLKKLHRLIVTSATYRQSSAARPAGMAKDAGNRLLWRMPLRRLEAEALRDAILAVSGSLDRTAGGPGFRLFKYRVVNVAIYERLEDQGPETWRRGVYRQSARAIRDNLLANFDCPECAQQAPRREITTTPLQALSLLNGRFTLQQSQRFADRVQREAGPDQAAQVDRAFRLAFGRPPTPQEHPAAVSLVTEEGLAALCRVLLNANEFLYY